MTTSPLTEQLAERIERLLVRHEELQRTNRLLEQQVQALSSERDNLRSRLSAARARVEALIDRLPANAGQDTPSAHTTDAPPQQEGQP